MRNNTFFDWFCELLLLTIFCGAVTLADYLQTEKTPITTMWWIAGGWLVCGLVRWIWRTSIGPPREPPAS